MDNPPPSIDTPRSTKSLALFLIFSLPFLFAALLCVEFLSVPRFDEDRAPAFPAAGFEGDPGRAGAEHPDSAWTLYCGLHAASGQHAKNLSGKKPRKRLSDCGFSHDVPSSLPCRNISGPQQRRGMSVMLPGLVLQPSARGFIFFATPPPSICRNTHFSFCGMAHSEPKTLNA